MPRIASGRTPAAPSSAEQQQRYQRILRAAAVHGTERGFDRMQMQDVAKDAGVAIATLYRYFPSKVHLFTALMHESVGRLGRVAVEPSDAGDPAERVGRMLVVAGRALLERPLLARAMLQSNNAAVAGETPSSAVTDAFADLIYRIAGIEHPTAHEQRLVRLVEQTWYGVLISRLNGHIADEDAEADTLLACRLLLLLPDADTSAAGSRRAQHQPGGGGGAKPDPGGSRAG